MTRGVAAADSEGVQVEQRVAGAQTISRASGIHERKLILQRECAGAVLQLLPTEAPQILTGPPSKKKGVVSARAVAGGWAGRGVQSIVCRSDCIAQKLR
jgi:hypothetical protein